MSLFLFGCEQNLNEIPAETSTRIDSYLGETVDIYIEKQRVVLGAETFDVEIVDTPKLRRQGLMNREYLAEDEGMLFVFEHTAVYPFWMKNTLIPLQIIWINEEGLVVDAHNAVPCKTEVCPNYVPQAEAKYVLEIAG